MKNGLNLNLNMDEHILQALREDVTSEDITTNAIMRVPTPGKAELICKQDGILCGLGVFSRVFELLQPDSHFETTYKDGDACKKGELIGVIYADIRVLLTGERTALNYLQRMSGIATHTHQLVEILKGTNTILLDTRKTTPTLRQFEKYSVKVGGACNHRYNLSDGVLIKDNHICAAGSITKAVQMAKEYVPFVRKIEVETETLDQVAEAIEAGADIIMLDNMDNDTMRKAVEMIGGRAQTECSGNVTAERLLEIADIGVDFVSSGALTYASPALDVSLKNLEAF
ncbi:MAG: carboxylating nicotinate-nucleotide diphosphorylase [Butyricicoccaceae bacterium]